MPTVLRSGPYRLFFYSSDGSEPPHIHVARDDAVGKFWLRPVRHAHSLGFGGPELRRIESIISEQQTALLKAWHEYFAK
ncbi:MAG TPA: DUF4160 domain-containing protein [Gammaproteobacteria bacterium]|nr:DUF4160 domain-containing protein [Gammaproteobacteria bacterium]